MRHPAANIPASTARAPLSAAAVATLADVDTRYVNHLVDTHALPEAIYKTKPRRLFDARAPFVVALHARTADTLTLEARIKAAHQLLDCFSPVAPPPAHLHVVVIGYKLAALDIEPGISIDADAILRPVATRLERLAEANTAVAQDPGILSGTPVLKGTRVPVYDIAASLAAGEDINELSESYGITPAQAELAHLWARANPPVGRPRRTFLAPPRSGATTKHVARRRAANAPHR